jgi:EAL domain-containing protein (putative c-di-GMP-specific phosphodiesterase class I)
LAALEDQTLMMTINVSGKQLLSGLFVDWLAAALAAERIEPRRITIEVTESVLMAEDAVRELERVREIGCGIAIDDFGTGYSSLAYLRRLPVNIIKIDRSFVSPLGEDPETLAFLDALVKLVQTLNLTVIAEGVETRDQLRILSDMSCDAAQGYFIGKPSAVCDFEFAI